MSAKWRRNTVVLVMAVLVCAAVALNWKYTGEQAAAGAANAGGGKLLGEAALVSNPQDPPPENQTGTDSQTPAAPKDSEAPEDSSGEKSGTDSPAVTEAGVYSGSDYFASARLTRQQARDNAISLLQSAAEQEDASQDLADQASAGIQVLAGYTMKEAQIESLVAAKGYVDCVAFMGEDSVSIVVSTDSGELTAEDVAKITDIAVTETGYPASGVKIMPAN